LRRTQTDRHSVHATMPPQATSAPGEEPAASASDQMEFNSGASNTETGITTSGGTDASKGKAQARLKHEVLPMKQVAKDYIRNRPSDVQGLLQLAFHAGMAIAAGIWVHHAREQGSVAQLVASELALGFVASFYFAGFHETIHGTAFASRWLNRLVSHVVGFIIFRGANWYYYFHWHHHRFTNDPKRDPELSGTTLDRADPTKQESTLSRVGLYALFLSGYPFGFERLPGIAKYALGYDLAESWVDTDSKRRSCQREYIAFTLGYVALAVLSVACVDAVGKALVFYWIIPHMIGSGHLRYYQTAEHRACKMGEFTDTNAWLVSRTTPTWWLYTRLAWNMPYHQEHHAWPNVPFYLLPDVHKAVNERGTRPTSGCEPTGDHGFVWMHWLLFQRTIWPHAAPGQTQQTKAE